MPKWLYIMALLFTVPFLQTVSAEENIDVDKQAEWLFNTLKDSLSAKPGDTLSIHHLHGDVRVEADDTDKIQVTALAQYHPDDPRAPTIRFATSPVSGDNNSQQLIIDFAYLEVAEQEAWAKRRIDVGVLVPKNLNLNIETVNGLIELKKIEADAELKSARGDVNYRGKGNVIAHTERGDILARLYDTYDKHHVELSTLTGKIQSVFLEQANASITVSTRGTISTDYSIDIERESGSVLKRGKVQIGEKGSSVTIDSHNGDIKLEGLNVPEGSEKR